MKNSEGLASASSAHRVPSWFESNLNAMTLLSSGNLCQQRLIKQLMQVMTCLTCIIPF